MKRRNFFKNLAIGTGALIVAPKMIAEISLEEDKTNPNKILKEPFDIPKSDLYEHNSERLHETFEANIHNGNYFTTNGHEVMVDDMILVGLCNDKYIITKVFDEFNFKAIPIIKNFGIAGYVQCIRLTETIPYCDSHKMQNK